MEWMLLPFRRYAEFSGRSRRKEFWMFQLLGLLVGIIIYVLILAGGGWNFIAAAAQSADGSVPPADLENFSFGPLFYVGAIAAVIWTLAALIPSIAVTVRRLHDRNMSGWYLVGFVVAAIILSMLPILGGLLIFALEIGWIVLLALPGTRGPNKYGPDPLGEADAETFA